MKESGPADAAPPPAPPVDQGAVQSYFLDTQTGRWGPTILASQARQVSFELGKAYRGPYQTGLAIEEPQEDPARARRGSRASLAAGVAVLLLLGGAAVVAGQTLLGPSESADAAPTVAPAATGAPVATVTATAASPTAAPTAPPAGTAVRTQAPPPPPQMAPVKLKDGTVISYSGPTVVARGSTLSGRLKVTIPGGGNSYQSITIFLGNPDVAGGMVSARAVPDGNGNASFSLAVTIPRGAQQFRISYGIAPGLYTLGAITVQ